MPPPITVWAVELGERSRLDEVEGSLVLESGALVFRPHDDRRPAQRYPFDELARVRRLRGSPVLLIQRRVGTGALRTAFYFVRPPPLPPATETRRVVLGPLAGGSPRKVRRRNASYLGWSNREKKQQLREWEDAVKAALAARGGGA